MRLLSVVELMRLRPACRVQERSGANEPVQRRLHDAWDLLVLWFPNRQTNTTQRSQLRRTHLQGSNRSRSGPRKAVWVVTLGPYTAQGGISTWWPYSFALKVGICNSRARHPVRREVIPFTLTKDGQLVATFSTGRWCRAVVRCPACEL